MTDPNAPAVLHIEVEVDVPGGKMPATLYLPNTGKGPGISLLTDMYGPIPFYRAVASRLAAEGYVVLLSDYFFRQGRLPAETREEGFSRHSRSDEVTAIDDHAAAVSWLQRRPEVVQDRVGLLGFCLGGTIALNLCAAGANAVAVCYYAFPFSFGNPCRRKAPRPIDIASEISAPVLSHWGDADYIPLSEIEAFGAAMRKFGHPYTERVYSGAGHGFLAGLVERSGDSSAAHESWELTQAFFSRHLGGSR
ncbi:dienelactone hydrolase family protein [Rhodococcus opacus]|uniref:dienelactone hydrolase family protein n=1 Tax=Rhodococcus TaxID=1827 RepID=UPI0015F3EBED|nr:MULTISPECIES: dienelactone hydrolase family protein [Rhodococcus]